MRICEGCIVDQRPIVKGFNLIQGSMTTFPKNLQDVVPEASHNMGDAVQYSNRSTVIEHLTR